MCGYLRIIWWEDNNYLEIYAESVYISFVTKKSTLLPSTTLWNSRNKMYIFYGSSCAM